MDKKTIVIFSVGIICGFCIGAVAGAYTLAPPQAGRQTAGTGSLVPANSSPGPDDLISYLFVQEGLSGSLVKEQNNTMTLTIHGVRENTVYFSDRPARISGLVDTALFTTSSMWNGSNPPNAALMLPGAPESNDTVILTISGPEYYKTESTLVYSATLVPNYHGEGLKAYQVFADPAVPEEFGQVILFIDSASLPGDLPGSPVAKDNRRIF